MKRKLFALCLNLLLLSSCGLFDSSKKVKAQKIDGVKVVKNSWYKTYERFALLGINRRVPVHQFLDPAFKFDKKNNRLNVVAVTPEGSRYSYEISTTTGLNYSMGQYCSAQDSKNRYEKSLLTPPFTIAIVPRILNELGKPQDVIVFGRKEIFNRYTTGFSHHVRPIGGLLVGVCPYGKCEQKDWQKKLVIVAVSTGDSHFQEVTNIDDLKKKVDWVKVRAWIENSWGVNDFAGQLYPHFVVAKQMNVEEMTDYWEKNRDYFGPNQQKVLKKSCFKLYDMTWQKFRKDDGKFLRTWIDFLKEHLNDFNVCRKYVLPSELTFDQNRHWLFTYLIGFIQMDDLEMIYNCKRESWVERDSNSGSFMSGFKNCTDRQLNSAFSSMTTILKSLSGVRQDYYSFLEYDDSDGGSHQRFYWWVLRPGYFPRCEENQRAVRKIFPDDINWKNKNESDSKKSNVIY